MEIKQYDLENSLMFFFEREADIKTDIIYDGYEIPNERPLITIEPMQNNYESISKQREAMQVIYRFQIGLRAGNPVEKRHKQEEISELLTTRKIPYFNTQRSVDEPVGYFLCNLTAVVPMPADEINRKSENHRVYFDVEIEDIKRRWQ